MGITGGDGKLFPVFQDDESAWIENDLEDADVQEIGLYSTLLYSTLLYSTLLYSTLLYSTLLYSTLLYSTLLYSTLLYSTLLYLYSTPAILSPRILNLIFHVDSGSEYSDDMSNKHKSASKRTLLQIGGMSDVQKNILKEEG